VRGQIDTRAHAGKDRIRAASLQPFACRTIADQHQLGRLIDRTHRVECGQQCGQILLRSKPTHVDCNQRIRPGAPRLPQDLVASMWAIQARIDAARDHAQVAESVLHQRAAQFFGRHHGALGAVMELAQIGHDRLVQPADPIVFAVRVKVGAEVRADRQPQLQRGLQRRPAERTFSRDMHHVRPARHPVRLQLPRRRQTHAQVRIPRNRQPAHEDLVETRPVVVAGLFGLLARADQLQLVIACAQPFDDARDRGCDAVDLGRIGLGDQRDTQRTPLRRQVIDDDRSRGIFAHDGIVPAPQNISMTARRCRRIDIRRSTAFHARASPSSHAASSSATIHRRFGKEKP